MSSAPIYDRFLDFCRLAELPSPWRRAPAGAETYIASGRARESLDWLEIEFGADAVIESGLAIAGSEGGLLPSERWPRPDSFVVPWRATPSDPPFGLLVESGSVRGDVLPVLAALGDDHTRRALVSQGYDLLLAPTLEDLVVLRAAGMAVTTAHGLGEATQEQIGAIEMAWPIAERMPPPPTPSNFSARGSDDDDPDDDDFDDDDRDGDAADQVRDGGDRDGGDQDDRDDDDRDGDDRDGDDDEDRDGGPQSDANEAAENAAPTQPRLPAGIRVTPHFTVAAWQVSQLSLDSPPNLPEVISACEGACAAAGTSWPWEVSQWRPKPEEFDHVRFLMRQQRVAELGDWLQHSMSRSSQVMFQDDVVTHQPSLLEADAAYRDALTSYVGRSDESHLAELRRDLVAAHQREVVQPFIVRAVAARHPARRALFVAAANVARKIQQIELELDEDRASESDDLRDGRHARVDRLQAQQTRLVDTLIRMQREMTR